MFHDRKRKTTFTSVQHSSVVKLFFSFFLLSLKENFLVVTTFTSSSNELLASTKKENDSIFQFQLRDESIHRLFFYLSYKWPSPSIGEKHAMKIYVENVWEKKGNNNNLLACANNVTWCCFKAYEISCGVKQLRLDSLKTVDFKDSHGAKFMMTTTFLVFTLNDFVSVCVCTFAKHVLRFQIFVHGITEKKVSLSVVFTIWTISKFTVEVLTSSAIDHQIKLSEIVKAKKNFPQTFLKKIIKSSKSFFTKVSFYESVNKAASTMVLSKALASFQQVQVILFVESL